MTYGLSCLDGNLRHANIRLVEVLDCLGGHIRGLVADIANATLGDQLDIGDFAAIGGEVFPKVGF